jgi:hypothetical protein
MGELTCDPKNGQFCCNEFQKNWCDGGTTCECIYDKYCCTKRFWMVPEISRLVFEGAGDTVTHCPFCGSPMRNYLADA